MMQSVQNLFPSPRYKISLSLISKVPHDIKLYFVFYLRPLSCAVVINMWSTDRL